jgi:hypothetical protein
MRITREEMQQRLERAQREARHYEIIALEDQALGDFDGYAECQRYIREERAKAAFWAREISLIDKRNEDEATYGELTRTPKSSDYLAAQRVIRDMQSYFRNKPVIKPFHHLPKPRHINTVKYDGDTEC